MEEISSYTSDSPHGQQPGIKGNSNFYNSAWKVVGNKIT